MPIHVTIAINDRVIEQVHIARISGGSGRVHGKEHTYSVLVQDNAPVRDEEWDNGAMFVHSYGSGLHSLVQAGLEALHTPKVAEQV